MNRIATLLTRSPTRANRLMRWGLVCALVLAAGSTVNLEAQEAKVSADALASDPAWLLFVTQDESSMERILHKYFTAREQWTMSIREIAENDIVIEIMFTSENAPDIKLHLDTMPSNTKDDGMIVERRVFVKYYCVLPDSAKTPAMRSKLLEFNNKWMLNQWAPLRVLLDSDGDIQCEAMVNIPYKNVPIHAESVLDMVLRMVGSWEKYYVAMSAELGIEVL